MRNFRFANRFFSIMLVFSEFFLSIINVSSAFALIAGLIINLVDEKKERESLRIFLE